MKLFTKNDCYGYKEIKINTKSIILKEAYECLENQNKIYENKKDVYQFQGLKIIAN